MRILALSDEKSQLYYNFYTPGKLDEFDLILCCGDLDREYLEFFATLAHCPVVYVPGNHDDRLKKEPPGGCLDADGHVLTVKGVRILGLGGSIAYRPGVYMYTEQQMAARVRKVKREIRRAGGFDILMTHSPARGLNDFDSPSHKGFECFNGLLETYRPKLFVHGHIHTSYGAFIPRASDRNGILVVNACEAYAFDYPG